MTRRNTGTRAAAIAVAIAALGVTACSHRTLQVERAMVLPPGAQTHAVESNQRFLMAAPIEDPDPVFPAGARLDGVLQLCTTFGVTTDGAVVDIAFDREDPACADPADDRTAPFAGAVRQALQRWRYFGAAVCTFPDGRDPGADPRCDGPDVRINAVPIALRYVFAFSSERGGRVSRSPAAH